MRAIILDRNKTYCVEVGTLLKIDYLPSEVDSEFKISNVVFYYNDKKSFIGSPLLDFVTVSAKVIKQIKAEKVISLKFRRRKHYMKKVGHRQRYTLIKILSIDLVNKEI